ncbi:MAG: hypothetical protein ABSC94_12280 [Polyangiaceae bacterium]|jgi:hypothetical protein
MTRSILATLASAIAITVLSGTGCQTTGVGDPCVPELEYLPSFLGFSEQEVSVESKSFQCQSFLCLVNHFQGRVSCPYGQTSTATGNPGPNGTTLPACSMPNGAPVTGTTDGKPESANDPYADPNNEAQVLPQCISRQTADAVYCSCRCANVNGQTNDGANYCTCPDGYSCTQLVSSIGPADQGLTGAYCIKQNSQYDPVKDSCGASVPNSECDGTKTNCGPI